MANVSSTLSDKVLIQQAASGDAAITYTAAEHRRLAGAIWNLAGIVKTGDFNITQRAAGANWSIDIAPGLAVVPANASDEKYVVRLGSTLNVVVSTLNTAPAATRTHKVFLAVYDKLIAGTAYGAAIFVGEDTGSGAPNPTGSPVGYIQLGTFTISPAQASVQTAHINNFPTYAGFDQPWTTLTLGSGLVAGDALRPPAWMRVGNRVEFRGLIQKSAPPLTQGQVLFNIPFTLRPNTDVMPTVALGLGSDGLVRTGSILFRNTANSGNALVYFAPAAAGTSPAYVRLDGCSYDVD